MVDPILKDFITRQSIHEITRSRTSFVRAIRVILWIVLCQREESTKSKSDTTAGFCMASD
jgi:hypothetical protein